MRTVYLLLLVVFYLNPELAQSLSDKDLHQQVQGILLYGNLQYLVTQNGFLLLPDIETNNFYQQYYRKVYGDSTIVNPNTVLQTQNDYDFLSYIIPFINLSEAGKNFMEFHEGTKLEDFLQIDNSGKLEYRQGIYSLIAEHLRAKK